MDNTLIGRKIYCDARLGGVERYILTDNPNELMQVPEEARKCVAFIGYRNTDGMYKVGGTAFFLARHDEAMHVYFRYVVTAKHVIDKIRDKGVGGRACLRMNFKDAGARWIEIDQSYDWFFHPTDSEVDVAVLKWGYPDECDHIPLGMGMLVGDEHIAMHEIGYGDDVCITGLFARHYGLKRNIPIVRIGNIAAMPEEQVETRLGLIDAYLIEARSIGGLSGSPVFINLGHQRFIGNRLVQSPSGRPVFFLLGLVHGHWDVDTPSDYDLTSEDSAVAEKVNMGIAIVTPASKIREVIEQPMVRKQEDKMAREMRDKRLPAADSAEEEMTQEGFEEALRRASRKVPQPESEEGEE